MDGFIKMKTIYLLRHEECDGSGYIGSGSDVDLSSEGKINTSETAKYIKEIRFDRIYTSPMKRCMQTVDPIIRTGNRRLVPVTDDRLKELDFGLWEGKSWSSIESTYPKSLKRWLGSPMEETPPEGENLTQLYKRVESFWTDKVEGSSESSILIVSHGGPIRAVLSDLTGGGITHHWAFRINRGNFSLVEIYDDKAHQVI